MIHLRKVNQQEAIKFNESALESDALGGCEAAPQLPARPALRSPATLTPFVALEIAQLRSNGFTEGALNGAGLLALNVQGQTGASVPGYVGARLSRAFLLDNGMVFTPTIQAAYLHEFAPQRTLTAGLVNLPGSTFLVDGARASSNAAQVKAGAELTLTANVRAFATFDGEFSGVEQVYAGKGGLRYTW